MQYSVASTLVGNLRDTFAGHSSGPFLHDPFLRHSCTRLSWEREPKARKDFYSSHRVGSSKCPLLR